MSALRSFVSSKVEYMKVLQATTGMNVEEMAGSLQDHKAAIMDAIRSEPHLSVCDATAYIQLFSDSPFSSVDRAEMSRALNGIVNARVGISARQSTQSCLYFPRFVPTSLWAEIGNPHLPMFRKMGSVVKFMVDSLGLTHANESTYLTILATMLMVGCQVPDDAFKLDPNDFYVGLRDLKSGVRTSRARGHLPHRGALLIYPHPPPRADDK